ncbi:MAG: nickel-dependent hydrogenase large subunit [Halopseudomonas sp.]
MSIEGKIHIRLDPGSEFPVAISSSRPRQVMQLLQGLAPAALQQKVPMLYALCGKAQALAASQALIAAGAELRVTPKQQRDVIIEALQEYLWRFLIDLPQRLHKPPALPTLALLRKALVQISTEPLDSDEVPYLLQKLDTSLRADFLGMSTDAWLALDIAGLDNWLDQYPVALPTGLRELRRELEQMPEVQSEQLLLASTPDAQWLQGLGAELASRADFAFQPNWQGKQPETGALSYQQQQPWLIALQQRGCSPVLLRMIARLFELVQLRIWLDAPVEQYASSLSGSLRLGSDTGLGWVRTARGLLVHRVQLAQAVVSDYQIIAPTEWNFHPHGPLLQGLQQWLSVASDQLPDWVGLQVLSLDPCVQYQFEVQHA